MKNRNFLQKIRLIPVFIVTVTTFSVAYAQHSDQETKEDVQRHRAMVAAHEGAAKCLESGRKEEVCLKELQTVCKGLAIGKYCGMKHGH